jgi:predicted metal-binding membrane protein
MTHLSAPTGPLAPPATLARATAILSRPRLMALGCIAVLAAAGWAFLLLTALAQGPAGLSGFIDAICRPVPTASAGFGIAGVVGAMWIAMTLGMMLPTAGPMILTYAEIAETAARKRERIVSPQVLIAGYLSVWFGFALFATLAQLGVMAVAEWPGVARIAIPGSALLFLAAGLYQFSALKQACLTACQRPFSFFFLNWTDRPLGVFRLGVKQGLYCLGCCVAMMLLMFAAGAMNLLWMALLGLVMMIEKMTAARHFSRAVGIALVAAGLAILIGWATGFVS